jgi:spermidine synthase
LKNQTQLKAQLLIIFFLSGITGLAYQISWIRQISLIFGSTVSAISSVTAIFFAFIALGSWLIGKTKSNSASLFSRVQLSIAVLGILTIPLFYIFQTVTTMVYPSIAETIFLPIYRVLAIALVLAPAATAIGATFPLMVDLFPSKDDNESGRFGVVYAINSFGALIGVLITALFLMERVGNLYIVIFAAVINIGISVWVKAKISVDNNKEVIEANHSNNKVVLSTPLLLFFLIGFTGVSVQIVWTRFISLILHNTVYTYSITIAAAIGGIALGAALGTKFGKNTKAPFTVAGVLLLLSATFTSFALLLPAEIWFNLRASTSLVFKISIISALIATATLFSGAAFPILYKALSPQKDLARSTSASIMVFNSVGGVLGSLITLLILIPTIGLLGSIISILSLFLLIGVLSFKAEKGNYIKWIFILLPILPLLFWIGNSDGFTAKYAKGAGKILYLNEGKQSTVAVVEYGDLKVMEVDGLWQGESVKNQRIMAAHIPMLLSEGADNVLVVGAGTGATAKRFIQYDIDSLHLVNIDKAIFDAAEKKFDASWMNSEGVKKIVADGRSYLAYTDSKYDLISLEISQSNKPYSTSFYTKEFYKSVNRTLTDDGLVCQLMPVASFTSNQFRSVIKTFINQFPNSQLWYNRREYLLVGYKEEVATLDTDFVKKWLSKNTEVFKDLEYSYWGGQSYNLNRIDVLTANYLVGPDNLKKLAESGEVYSHAIPALEYETAREQNAQPFIDELRPYLSSFSEVQPIASNPKISQSLNFIRDLNLKDIIAAPLLRQYRKGENYAFLDAANKQNPFNLDVLKEMGKANFRNGNELEALNYLMKASKLDPKDGSISRDIGTLYLKNKNFDMATSSFLMAIDADSTDYIAHHNLAMTLIEGRNYSLALKHFTIAAEINPNYTIAVESRDRLKEALKKMETGNEN